MVKADENKIFHIENASTSLEQFLNDIAKYSLLSKEEEIELSKKIINGDQKALAKLIDHNHRLVVNIAYGFWENYKGKIKLDELISFGEPGLLRAAQKFDYRFDVRFSTYAYPHIKEAILKELNKYLNIASIPKDIQTKINTIYSIKNNLIGLKNREISDEELVKELRKHGIDISISKLNQLLSLRKQVSSIDKEIKDNIYAYDLIADDLSQTPEDYVTETNTKKALLDAMNLALNNDEKYVITRTYGLDGNECESYASIGRSIGVGRERVRQIANKAKAKLKHAAPELANYIK